MKKCIWCLQDENHVPFLRLAHTVPQSLGGKNICLNVCDRCNSYFGNYDNKMPPIETVLKEVFNISRASFLHLSNEIGKNKAMARFSSSYFDVNFEKGHIKAKGSYKFQQDFQEQLGRQLKRGIYKMILEEIERQTKEGHLPKFDFIREYSRNNIGDLPLFYFDRKHGMIAMSLDWVKTPEIFIQDKRLNYLMKNESFLEIEFLGHVFGIVLSHDWDKNYAEYLELTKNIKSEFFNGFKIVKHFSDIDFTLQILKD